MDLVVVSKQFLTGEISLDFSAISTLALKYGIFMDSITAQKDLKSLGDLKKSSIVVIGNEDMDKMIETDEFFKHNKGEIVLSEGVIFLRENPIILVPIESDIPKLLKESFDKIQSFCGLPYYSIFRLYGKRKKEIEEELKGKIQKEFFVFEKGLFCDIYINSREKEGFVSDEETVITNLFQDKIYSQSNLNIEEAVAKLLELKKKKINISDAFTNGLVAQKLLGLSKRVLSDTFNVEEENGFIKTPENRCYKDENDLVSQLSYRKMEEKNVEVSIVVVSKDMGDFERIFVGIYDKNKIDVYNLSLKGDKDLLFEIARQSIMFNLMKKLQEKDFEN